MKSLLANQHLNLKIVVLSIGIITTSRNTPTESGNCGYELHELPMMSLALTISCIHLWLNATAFSHKDGELRIILL